MLLLTVATALLTGTATPGRSQPSANPPPPEVSADAASTLKEEAVTVATQLAEAHPDDALVHALLGSAYYNTGRSGEAVRCLRKCLELKPNQADAYEVLALIAYEKGDLDETTRLCREALTHGPANPEVLNRLGRALMDLGEAEQAIPPLQQATSLPRSVSESSYLLGQAYLQSGDPARARETFLKTVQRAPDHTQAYFGLFTACTRLEQIADAERYREQFQKLEAMDRRALADRNAQEDTRTGLPQVQRTVARTFFGAAQVQNLHGEPGKAASLFLRAATLDPDNPTYRAALEAQYLRHKDPAGGIRTFESMVADQPGNTLNHFFLGRLHQRLEQVDDAERCFLKVIDLTPGWAEGPRALAELYLRANRNPAEARRLARRAADLEPSGPNLYLLAVACVKSGDRPGAIAALREALTRSPGEARYQQLLQRLEAGP